MYLSTGDCIAILIALLSALTVLGYALYQNKTLIKHNNWLVKRNHELRDQISKMVEVPF